MTAKKATKSRKMASRSGPARGREDREVQEEEDESGGELEYGVGG